MRLQRIKTAMRTTNPLIHDYWTCCRHDGSPNKRCSTAHSVFMVLMQVPSPRAAERGKKEPKGTSAWGSGLKWGSSAPRATVRRTAPGSRECRPRLTDAGCVRRPPSPTCPGLQRYGPSTAEISVGLLPVLSPPAESGRFSPSKHCSVFHWAMLWPSMDQFFAGSNSAV
jgi:hypothetical protein